MFGAAYSSVDRKLNALLGGGTSQNNTFRTVVRYDPYSPASQAETPVADLSSVPLQAFSVPPITLNGAARTLQILTTNPNTVYSVDISGTTSSASALPVLGSTFNEVNYSPVSIATNPLAGETYIASTSGAVEVLTLPSGVKAAGSIDLIASLTISTTGSTSNIRLLSFFPIGDAALSNTNITITATAASTGQSFTFATVGATTGKDLPSYISGTFPTADTYTLIAAFPGDATYGAFTSAQAVVAVGVSAYPTTVSATASGNGTTGTARVTLSGTTYAPTGQIRIKDAQSGTTLTTYFHTQAAILNPLSISFPYDSTVTSAVTATYSGDSKNGASTSAPATITSSLYGTTITLTTPATAAPNQAVTAQINMLRNGTVPPQTFPTGNIIIYG